MAAKHLILIHGFLEDATMWQYILPHLSKKNYVISTPELPGHGRNKSLPLVHDANAYCENLLNQLQLRTDDEAIIIGHSMGGYLSSTLATMMPCRLKALCLFHSKAGSDSAQKIEDRKRAIAAARENIALYKRTMITGIFGEKNREQCRSAIEKQIAASDQISFETIAAAQSVMISRPDRIEFMKSRNFSLYYFLGDQDTSLPIEVMKNEIEQLPGSVAHIAEGIGHMGHIERTKEAADFIQRMLRAED